jgi:membrane associated rhomboid family serine protease
MGATPAIVGLLALYCFAHRDRPITMLLFFIFPVTILPKYVLYFLVGIYLFGLVFGEIPSPAISAAGGFSAQLSAIAAAWAIERFYLRTGVFTLPSMPTIIPPSWAKNKTVLNKTSTTSYKVNLSAKSELKEELDRILDKINSEGFGALTDKEKRTLDKARDNLGK